MSIWRRTSTKQLLFLGCLLLIFPVLVFQTRILDLTKHTATSSVEEDVILTLPKVIAGSSVKANNNSSTLETTNSSTLVSTSVLQKDKTTQRKPTTHNRTRTVHHEEESFSACVLTMDDYPIWTEWLAYHYHVLPLRYLIVVVDRRSTVSPSPIFETWRKHGMHIEELSDDDISTSLANYSLPENATLKRKTALHRYRQKLFYQKCILTLRERKRTWTALFDTDEFLRFNLPYMKNFSVHEPLPSVEQAGSVLSFIKQQQARNDAPKCISGPCFPVPRLIYGPKPSTLEEQRRFEPPGMLNISNQLETLRFRFDSGSSHDGLGKAIMDVSRIGNKLNFMGVHRPLTICRHPFLHVKDSLFVLNEYKGFYRRYMYRDDARGRNSFDEFRRDFEGHHESDDNIIRPWLKGFAESQGIEVAKNLLKEAGRFPERIKRNQTKSS